MGKSFQILRDSFFYPLLFSTLIVNPIQAAESGKTKEFHKLTHGQRGAKGLVQKEGLDQTIHAYSGQVGGQAEWKGGLELTEKLIAERMKERAIIKADFSRGISRLLKGVNTPFYDLHEEKVDYLAPEELDEYLKKVEQVRLKEMDRSIMQGYSFNQFKILSNPAYLNRSTAASKGVGMALGGAVVGMMGLMMMRQCEQQDNKENQNSKQDLQNQQAANQAAQSGGAAQGASSCASGSCAPPATSGGAGAASSSQIRRAPSATPNSSGQRNFKRSGGFVGGSEGCKMMAMLMIVGGIAMVASGMSKMNDEDKEDSKKAGKIAKAKAQTVKTMREHYDDSRASEKISTRLATLDPQVEKEVNNLASRYKVSSKALKAAILSDDENALDKLIGATEEKNYISSRSANGETGALLQGTYDKFGGFSGVGSFVNKLKRSNAFTKRELDQLHQEEKLIKKVTSVGSKVSGTGKEKKNSGNFQIDLSAFGLGQSSSGGRVQDPYYTSGNQDSPDDSSRSLATKPSQSASLFDRIRTRLELIIEQ